MFQLQCGIELPEPSKNVVHKPTLKDYERCLTRLPEVLGGKLGRAVGYLHWEPAIALRFLGEMKIAGYIKYSYQKRYNTQETYMTDAVLKATPKLHEVPVHQYTAEPVEPVESIKGRTTIEVRRGVDRRNRYFKQDKSSYQVVKSIQKEPFVINDFILTVLEDFPALREKDDGYIMYKRCKQYARKHKESEFFYFPNYLDSRGRTYDATTVGFSPQGADHEKSMVLPYYKEPLTQEGYDALIEAAQGYSEQDWSVEEMINHARNWETTHSEWSKADKKYSYLACADLLRRYHDNPNEPLPSFTPLDGRCSGLQHWSALTCSTAITNRLGMEPNEAEDGFDIYEYVANEWKKTLPLDLQQFATRKAAKVPTMTWGYNATRMTSMEHIYDLFGQKFDKVDGQWVVVEEGLQRAPAVRLGSDLYNRLHETLNDLSEAVKWVSACALIMDREIINWTTPDGFVGQQKKVMKEELVIRVGLSDGSEGTCKLKKDTRKPAPRKHASALSPNIIHSLDATHLRMVARRLEEAGLPMVFIHDSFATHSNYRNTLYRFIVEEFIKLYSGNYLVQLKEEWESAYDVELPEPPSQGDWNVNTLESCERFFM